MNLLCSSVKQELPARLFLPPVMALLCILRAAEMCVAWTSSASPTAHRLTFPAALTCWCTRWAGWGALACPTCVEAAT